MVGHLHGGDDEVDAGVGDQPSRVAKGIDVPCRCDARSRFASAGRHGPKCELRQRLQRRHVSCRGPSAAGAGADDPTPSGFIG